MAGSQPVVGVVGAGHLKGIQRYWSAAGDPDTEAAVQRYMQASSSLPPCTRSLPACVPACLPACVVLARQAPEAAPACSPSLPPFDKQAPEEDTASPYLTGAVFAATVGTIAYRRPRAAALFAGAIALSMAPYLGARRPA